MRSQLYMRMRNQIEILLACARYHAYNVIASGYTVHHSSWTYYAECIKQYHAIWLAVICDHTAVYNRRHRYIYYIMHLLAVAQYTRGHLKPPPPPPPWCRIYTSMERVSTVSDNGLSPIRRQAIILTNDGLLSIGPLGTNFSENIIKIQKYSFTKMHLKISSAKWWPFCLGETS